MPPMYMEKWYDESLAAQLSNMRGSLRNRLTNLLLKALRQPEIRVLKMQAIDLVGPSCELKLMPYTWSNEAERRWKETFHDKRFNKLRRGLLEAIQRLHQQKVRARGEIFDRHAKISCDFAIAERKFEVQPEVAETFNPVFTARDLDFMQGIANTAGVPTS